MSRRTPTRNLWLICLAGDVLAISLAYYATFVLRFHSEWGRWLFGHVFEALGIREPTSLGPGLQAFYAHGAFRIILILAAILCPLYAFRNLYAGRRFIRKRPVAWNVIVVNVIALALFYSYFYARRNVFHPRSMFAAIALLNIVFCISLRWVATRVLRTMRGKTGIDECRAILVGQTVEADELDEFISTVKPHGIQIADRVVPIRDETDDDLIRRIGAATTSHDCDMIISADAGIGIQRMMKILEESGRLEVSAKILSGTLDVLVKQGRIPTDMVHGVPLVHFGPPSRTKIPQSVRHAACAVVAGVGMLILSPLLAVIAVLIRVTSAGPAIFVQERIGEQRKPFKMYKFRTMQHLADELQAQLEELNELGKGLFKMKKDPRATWVGRLLRRFSLDELPQLVNVIKGEMTIVGPRPLPRRDFENYYEDWHYLRHSGRPGLTGLWQVSGRSEVDFQHMCILDVYYLRNRNIILDMKIIVKTIWVVLFARGAY